MELNLSKILTELHGISKRPLMSSDFTKGSSHKDGSHFINNQKFGDIVRICPHNCKFLSASFSVEFRD